MRQLDGRVLTSSEAIHRLACANNSTSTSTSFVHDGRSTRLRWSSSSCHMRQKSDAEDSAQRAAAERAHVARRLLVVNRAGDDSDYARDTRHARVQDDAETVVVQSRSTDYSSLEPVVGLLSAVIWHSRLRLRDHGLRVRTCLTAQLSGCARHAMFGYAQPGSSLLRQMPLLALAAQFPGPSLIPPPRREDHKKCFFLLSHWKRQQSVTTSWRVDAKKITQLVS